MHLSNTANEKNGLRRDMIFRHFSAQTCQKNTTESSQTRQIMEQIMPNEVTMTCYQFEIKW